MRSQPINLIVGSDSFIGKALMAHLQRAGKRVVGTTRRHEAVDKFHLYLDLSEDVETWQCPWPVSVAVVCAGVTKLDVCSRDPVTSAHVNVQGVSTLVKNLVAGGAFVIYLSTNQVFDGSVPYRLPNDPLSPITEYGRQKAETERRISQWNDSVAIVRFTKILGLGISPFSEWTEALKKGKNIHPFVDMYIAPVPLSCAVSVLHLVVDQRLPNILQVSGGVDVSYAEAAYRGASLLGADLRLVQPVKAHQSNKYTEPVPLHTTLNIDRLRSMLGIEPPNVWWTIEKAFIQPHVLLGIY
ncbi:MAG: sugar nucleotide-binding protein [bacterium]|nr:sugar nucleotide-binding protein [bacterium]